VQGAEDTVAAGIELANLLLVVPGGFNDAAGRGVDDSGDATTLGVEGIGF